MENGELRIENGEWRMNSAVIASGAKQSREWRIENGEWRIVVKNICCILSLFLLCLPACKWKSLPPDIWEKEKMIEFLVDAQLLEAKVSIKELPKKQSDSLYACYYKELFAYHNTTQEIWNKNIEYYRNYPEEMDEIYKEVVALLTLLESTVQYEQQSDFAKNNSISLKDKMLRKRFDRDSLQQTDSLQQKKLKISGEH